MARRRSRRSLSFGYFLFFLFVVVTHGADIDGDEFYDAADICSQEQYRNDPQCRSAWADIKYGDTDEDDADMFHDAAESHYCDPSVDKTCAWSYDDTVPDGMESDVSEDGSVSSEDSMWSFNDGDVFDDRPPPPKEAPPLPKMDGEEEAFPEFPPWLGKKEAPQEDFAYKKAGGGIYSYLFGKKTVEKEEVNEEYGMDNIPKWSTFG